MIIGILLIIYTILTTNVFSEDKVPVFIDGQSKDDLGRKLIYNVKQEIGKSKTLMLRKDKDTPSIWVSIVTLDPHINGTKDLSSLYGVAWIADIGTKESIINHAIGICGKNVIKDVAERIVVDTDGYIKTFKALSELEQRRIEIDSKNYVDRIAKQIENELGLENKIKELESGLEKERAKTWWQKLW